MQAALENPVAKALTKGEMTGALFEIANAEVGERREAEETFGAKAGAIISMHGSRNARDLAHDETFSHRPKAKNKAGAEREVKEDSRLIH